MTEDPGACTERELTDAVALCRPDGTLAPDAVGWARHPVIDCTLHGSWGRRKRWDFWSVTGPGFAMNLTYADVDYLGLADVWFHDLGSGASAAAAAPVPLARGMALPPRAGEGGVALAGRKLELRFADGARGTQISVAFPTGRGPFRADVLVTRPPDHESLTVVIPGPRAGSSAPPRTSPGPPRGRSPGATAPTTSRPRRRGAASTSAGGSGRTARGGTGAPPPGSSAGGRSASSSAASGPTGRA